MAGSNDLGSSKGKGVLHPVRAGDASPGSSIALSRSSPGMSGQGGAAAAARRGSSTLLGKRKLSNDVGEAEKGIDAGREYAERQTREKKWDRTTRLDNLDRRLSRVERALKNGAMRRDTASSSRMSSGVHSLHSSPSLPGAFRSRQHSAGPSLLRRQTTSPALRVSSPQLRPSMHSIPGSLYASSPSVASSPHSTFSILHEPGSSTFSMPAAFDFDIRSATPQLPHRAASYGSPAFGASQTLSMPLSDPVAYSSPLRVYQDTFGAAPASMESIDYGTYPEGGNFQYSPQHDGAGSFPNFDFVGTSTSLPFTFSAAGAVSDIGGSAGYHTAPNDFLTQSQPHPPTPSPSRAPGSSGELGDYQQGQHHGGMPNDYFSS